MEPPAHNSRPQLQPTATAHSNRPQLNPRHQPTNRLRTEQGIGYHKKTNRLFHHTSVLDIMCAKNKDMLCATYCCRCASKLYTTYYIVFLNILSLYLLSTALRRAFYLGLGQVKHFLKAFSRPPDFESG